MKTKEIPFSLEMVEKIQNGEIKGIIRTRGGKIARFLGEIKDPAYPLMFAIRGDITGVESPRSFTLTGNYYDIDSEHYHDIILEIPDTKPQFKVGDKVRIKPNDTHSHFVKQYDNCIGKIVGEYHERFVVVVTGVLQAKFLAEELELFEETGKYEFKPFDKVLVRDRDDLQWRADIFSHMKVDKYICVGTMWEQCILYKGNEHLLGTNNKPKED